MQKGYGPEVDWWSLGVIMFEMMVISILRQVGYPPFFSDNTTDTCHKILNWKNSLKIPDDCKLSQNAIHLIKSLLTDVDNRLGFNGANEIKNHPFFKGVDWENYRSLKVPFIPTVNSDYDTKYFDKFDDIDPYSEKELNTDETNKKLVELK